VTGTATRLVKEGEGWPVTAEKIIRDFRRRGVVLAIRDGQIVSSGATHLLTTSDNADLYRDRRSVQKLILEDWAQKARALIDSMVDPQMQANFRRRRQDRIVVSENDYRVIEALAQVEKLRRQMGLESACESSCRQSLKSIQSRVNESDFT